MKRFGAKLAFTHRTLWRRDAAYRWAVLLGPPPLLGVAFAAGVLAAVHAFELRASGQATNAPWAQWTRPAPDNGQPVVESTAKLPPTDAGGHYVGFEPGWRGVVQPLSIDPAMTIGVVGTVLGRFALDRPAVSLGRIVDAGPASGLFVGAVNASFVVRTPGLYGFSARLTRSAAQSASCLLWLETARHKMFRNVSLNVGGEAVLSYDTTEYRLEPGLLRLRLAAGCWRGQTTVGGGEVVVMVRRPGQTVLQPVAADDLISPVHG